MYYYHYYEMRRHNTNLDINLKAKVHNRINYKRIDKVISI